MKHDLTDKEKALIREGIQEKYVKVAESPSGCFRFPTGEKGIIQLGYPAHLWKDLPKPIRASFCGVGNPFSLGPVNEGESVLDIGCGAGFDALVAAALVGLQGRVIGLDVTEKMIEKAKENLSHFPLENLSFQVGEAEDLPFQDNEFELALSNGALNLTLDKEKVLSEAFRVLKPGGRLMVADMVLVEELPPEREKRLENWYQ